MLAGHVWSVEISLPALSFLVIPSIALLFRTITAIGQALVVVNSDQTKARWSSQCWFLFRRDRLSWGASAEASAGQGLAAIGGTQEWRVCKTKAEVAHMRYLPFFV